MIVMMILIQQYLMKACLCHFFYREQGSKRPFLAHGLSFRGPDDDSGLSSVALVPFMLKFT